MPVMSGGSGGPAPSPAPTGSCGGVRPFLRLGAVGRSPAGSAATPGEDRAGGGDAGGAEQPGGEPVGEGYRFPAWPAPNAAATAVMAAKPRAEPTW